MTLFLQFSVGEELLVCLRCRANLRYEMLAEYLRENYPSLKHADVVELDRNSPLRPHLATARTYKRTFFNPELAPETLASDGAEMQDITKLTFADESVDIMISSEVLEHVPDLSAAFTEMKRVLRPNGVHIFTVPPALKTKQLASYENGQVRQIVFPPEYHGDNNGQNGILAYWHLGADFPQHIDVAGLELSIVKGPEGVDRRIIWQAKRLP